MNEAFNQIEQAREKARRARLRLEDDVALLRDRTRPATLVGDAAHEVATRVSGRPLAVAAGVAALGLALAIPGVRRAGLALGRGIWRNRAPIGRFIVAVLPAARRRDRKDR